jgi:uncharacterized DUF497 family protein
VEFEWDPEKNRANIAKHGIDFEDAIAIFEGPVLEKTASRRDYGEVRLLAFGLANGRELAIVYTLRGEGRRRIISARRADRRERKEYRQAFPENPPAR